MEFISTFVYKRVLVCPNGYLQQQPLIVMDHILILILKHFLSWLLKYYRIQKRCKGAQMTTLQDKEIEK